MFEAREEAWQVFREEGRQQQDVGPGVHSGDAPTEFLRNVCGFRSSLQSKDGPEDFLSQGTDRCGFRKDRSECRLQMHSSWGIKQKVRKSVRKPLQHHGSGQELGGGSLRVLLAPNPSPPSSLMPQQGLTHSDPAQ